jgi:hypothetical protein
MAELEAGGSSAAAADEESGYAAQWQSTLWAMVAVQFVMTMAFSMLTPIMPLLLPDLGVQTAGGIDIWAGILSAPPRSSRPLLHRSGGASPTGMAAN